MAEKLVKPKNMDWNERYNNKDTPWDKGQATPVLDYLIQKLPQYFKPGITALVPGCGIGHDVAKLHQSGINAFGLDISEAALKIANKKYPSLNDFWLIDDLFNITHLNNKYDLIWEHTCYCAIPREKRTQYVQSVYNLLKPGAHYAGVFFTDTGQPPEIGPPFSTTRDEAVTHFEKFFEILWEKKPKVSYPGRENREWIMIWRKPIAS